MQAPDLSVNRAIKKKKNSPLMQNLAHLTTAGPVNHPKRSSHAWVYVNYGKEDLRIMDLILEECHVLEF